jgi:Calcineurin-like phosphoesterase
MSDLHIEFTAMELLPIEGDVLLLNGDITVSKCLDPSLTDPEIQSLRSSTHKLFDEARAKFDHVIFIGGNHEPYHYDVIAAEQDARERLAGDGIHYLENETVEIDDVAFIGCTLWTDMEKRDPQTLYDVGRGLNDFNLCSYGDVPWTPELAADRHDQSVAYIANEVTKRSGQPIVVVTHHAPSRRGLHPAHRGNGLDGGFASDLDDFIVDRPAIGHWVFGHTHVCGQWQIGETQLYANCRGYVGQEQTGFDVNAHFVI